MTAKKGGKKRAHDVPASQNRLLRGYYNLKKCQEVFELISVGIIALSQSETLRHSSDQATRVPSPAQKLLRYKNFFAEDGD